MRLSRPCYDKSHRCPGGAGGGWKFPRNDNHDCGGYVTAKRPWVGGDDDYPGHPNEHSWRFGHCNKCDVVTWPVGLCHAVDPTWWKFALMRSGRRISDSWDDWWIHRESVDWIYRTRWRRHQ